MRWVLGEAARNLATGTTRALRWMVVLAGVLGALVVTELRSIDQLLLRASEFQAAGGAVQVMQAPGLVDPEACDRLRELPGVRAAGALRSAEAMTVSVLPRAPLSGYDVTPGLLEVLATTGEGEGVALAEAVAVSLGVGPGDAIATTSGVVRVAAVYAWPDDGRRTGFGHAALIPRVRLGAFDECWMVGWPVLPNAGEMLGLTLLPDADGRTPVSIGQLNTTNGTTFDGGVLFAQRATRYAAEAAVVGGGVVGFAAVRSRRLELASGRHVGVRARDQHLGMLAETAAWATGAVVLLVAFVAVLLGNGSGVDDRALWSAGARVIGWGAAAGVVGAQLAVVATRERHLFRYFSMR